MQQLLVTLLRIQQTFRLLRRQLARLDWLGFDIRFVLLLALLFLCGGLLLVLLFLLFVLFLVGLILFLLVRFLLLTMVDSAAGFCC